MNKNNCHSQFYFVRNFHSWILALRVKNCTSSGPNGEKKVENNILKIKEISCKSSFWEKNENYVLDEKQGIF